MNITESRITVIVKPGSPKNRIVKHDRERDVYIVEVKAKAEDNKANIELIKFLSKKLGKKVKIFAGLRNRKKVVHAF